MKGVQLEDVTKNALRNVENKENDRSGGREKRYLLS